jgi:hypothetical protein
MDTNTVESYSQHLHPSAEAWLSIRLFARGFCNKPACFVTRLNNSKPICFQENTLGILKVLVSKRRNDKQINENVPLIVFVHIDEFHFLQQKTCNYFVKEVLLSLSNTIQSLLNESNALLVSFLTAIIPANKLIELSRLEPLEIPLTLLNLEIMFQHLNRHRRLFAIDSDVRRWKILLTDIGAIPILYAKIRDALRDDNCSFDTIVYSILVESNRRIPDFEPSQKSESL